MTQTKLKIVLCAVVVLALLFFSSFGLASSIREVQANSRSLILIHTALGYSTILEFPTKPISAVLGDQDGFKLEYVGNGITLKPLVANARSNLFVFTDMGRFNFSIQTGNANSVDYIVSIKTPSDVPKTNNQRESTPYLLLRVQKKSSSNGITLTVEQIKLTRDSSNPRSASLIEFSVASKAKPYALQASSFGIRQGGKYLDFESIYLEQLVLAPGTSVNGTIAILNQDWKRGAPIALVIAVTDPANPKAKNKKSKTTRITVVVSTASGSVQKKGGKNGDKETGLDLFPKPHP